MEIKIEGTPEFLQELHIQLFELDEKLEIDEQYGPNEGFQKEPVTLALIVTAASHLTTSLIKEGVKIVIAKFKANAEVQKAKIKADLELAKFSIKEANKWKQVDLESLILPEPEKKVVKKSRN